MAAKYSHGVWEQFADTFGIFKFVIELLDFKRNLFIYGRGHFLHVFAKLMVPN